jgi:hypothetical protein
VSPSLSLELLLPFASKCLPLPGKPFSLDLLGLPWLNLSGAKVLPHTVFAVNKHSSRLFVSAKTALLAKPCTQPTTPGRRLFDAT